MRNYSLAAGWTTSDAPGPNYCVESHWVKAGATARFSLPGLTVHNLGRTATAVFLVARGLFLSNQPVAIGEPASYAQETLW